MINKYCYVIAEIGVNHNGSTKIARKLIDKAKWSGANAVKFQLYNVEENYHLHSTSNKTLEWSKNLLLTYDNFRYLKKYSENLGLDFFCSIFDLKSFNNYIKLKPKIIKIPSSEVNNVELLNVIKNSKLKVIFSSGIINKNTISDLKKFFKRDTYKHKYLSENVYSLYCVSKYPSHLCHYNMNYYKKLFCQNFFEGISDHTITNDVSSIGAFIGMKIIEKHIKLQGLKCPDEKVSLSPIDFKNMVDNIRVIENMNNNYSINVSDVDFTKKGLYAKSDINIGDIFTINNLTLKKPLKHQGYEDIKKLLGKKSKKIIKQDNPIIKTR